MYQGSGEKFGRVGHCNFYFFPVAIKTAESGSELGSVGLAETQIFFLA